MRKGIKYRILIYALLLAICLGVSFAPMAGTGKIDVISYVLLGVSLGAWLILIAYNEITIYRKKK
jgi:hypothetical protein